jgi:hypothetical protein
MEVRHWRSSPLSRSAMRRSSPHQDSCGSRRTLEGAPSGEICKPEAVHSQLITGHSYSVVAPYRCVETLRANEIGFAFPGSAARQRRPKQQTLLLHHGGPVLDAWRCSARAPTFESGCLTWRTTRGPAAKDDLPQRSLTAKPAAGPGSRPWSAAGRQWPSPTHGSATRACRRRRAAPPGGRRP